MRLARLPSAWCFRLNTPAMLSPPCLKLISLPKVLVPPSKPCRVPQQLCAKHWATANATLWTGYSAGSGIKKTNLLYFSSTLLSRCVGCCGDSAYCSSHRGISCVITPDCQGRKIMVLSLLQHKIVLQGVSYTVRSRHQLPYLETRDRLRDFQSGAWSEQTCRKASAPQSEKCESCTATRCNVWGAVGQGVANSGNHFHKRCPMRRWLLDSHSTLLKSRLIHSKPWRLPVDSGGLTFVKPSAVPLEPLYSISSI